MLDRCLPRARGIARIWSPVRCGCEGSSGIGERAWEVGNVGRGPINDTLATAPIGIFDSGLGGLSVLRDVRRLLPHEEIIYAADSSYCPYGTRSPQEILDRSLAMAGALIARGIKLLIVACNTACAIALPELRARFHIPIVGLEPAVKPAVSLTATARVGVLATPRTVASPRFASLVKAHANGVTIDSIPAPGLVELVEAGQTAGEAVTRALAPLIRPALTRGCDVFVLGCTHYPFLRDAIADLAGPNVPILDSGPAIARRTRELLAHHACANTAGPGRCLLLTTGAPETMRRRAEQLMGEPFSVAHLSLDPQPMVC